MVSVCIRGIILGAVGSNRINWITISSKDVLESFEAQWGWGVGVKGIDHCGILNFAYVSNVKLGNQINRVFLGNPMMFIHIVTTHIAPLLHDRMPFIGTCVLMYVDI